MDLINGNEIAQEIIEELKIEVSAIQGGKPCVVFIRVGEDPASISYVSKKEKTAEKIGIESRLQLYPNSISQNELLEEISQKVVRLLSDEFCRLMMIQISWESFKDLSRCAFQFPRY